MVKRGVYTGLEIVLLGVSSDTVLRRVVNIKVRDNGNNSSTSWIIQCFGYYGHGDSKKQNVSKGMLELLVSGVINFLRSLRTKWIWSMHNSKCKSIIWIKVKIARDHFLNHWRTQLLNVSKIYLNGIYCWHTGRESSFDVNYTEQLFLSNVWRRQNRPCKAMDYWGKIHSRESKKVGGSFADQDQPIRQRKLLSPGYRSQSKYPEKDQELSFSDVVLFCVIYLSS